MYIDGALLVDDDGLHGMLERCATRFMTAGLHSVYVTGFQAWGGVGMEIRYSGPDTGGVMTFMRVSPLPEPPASSSAGAAGAPPAAGPPSAAVSAPAVVLHGSDKSTQLNSELVIGKVNGVQRKRQDQMAGLIGAQHRASQNTERFASGSKTGTASAKKTLAAAHRHLDYLRGWVPKGSGHASVPTSASDDSWFSSWGDHDPAAPAQRFRPRSSWARMGAGRSSGKGDSWYESWVSSE